MRRKIDAGKRREAREEREGEGDSRERRKKKGVITVSKGATSPNSAGAREKRTTGSGDTNQIPPTKKGNLLRRRR